MTAQKQLKLPSTYRPTFKMEGHIGTEAFILQRLHSGTGGHVLVYAAWRSGSQLWEEVSPIKFELLVKRMLEQVIPTYNV